MKLLQTLKSISIWFIFIFLIIKFMPSYIYYINTPISFIAYILKFIFLIVISALGTSLFSSFIEESIHFFNKEYPTQVQNYYSMRYRINQTFKTTSWLRNLSLFLNLLYLYRFRLIFKIIRHFYKNKWAYLTFILLLVPIVIVAIIIIL